MQQPSPQMQRQPMMQPSQSFGGPQQSNLGGPSSLMNGVL
jgi:hypothetical protein